MTVRIEKNGAVWTVIHDRPEARNAMDPASADALTAAFLEFDADRNASVAVFYGAGGAFTLAGTSSTSVRSMLTVPSANSTSPLRVLVAMAARFRAGRWDPLAWNWTNPSSQRSKAPRLLAVWNWACGAISA